MPGSSGQCEATTQAGARCRARALPGRPLCTFHDPDHRARCQDGRRAGARTRNRPAAVLPEGTADLPLKTVADVVGLLGETINQTRTGRVDPKVANAVGYLGSVLLRALEGSDLEKRIAALEEAQRRRGPQRNGRAYT